MYGYCYVAGNPLGNEGLIALSEGFDKWKELKKLSIQSCGVDPQGLLIIATKAVSLLMLYISFNKMDYEVAEVISTRMKLLERLKAEKTGMTERMLVRIADSSSIRDVFAGNSRC